MAKRDFADVIGLRISRWQVIRDYLGGLYVITSIFLSGRQEGQREKKKETRQQKQRLKRCALKMEEKATGHGKRGECRRRKRWGNILPPGCSPLLFVTSSRVKQWLLFFWVIWAILSQIIKPRVAGTWIYSWLVRAQAATWDLQLAGKWGSLVGPHV